jgi:uncharacterized peroxidase-related enzyme
MPRISRLTRDQVRPSSREIYDRYMLQRGNVPNMFRTFAHRPEILESMAAHFEAILTTGTLPVKLKELVMIRTAQLNASAYCLASHTAIGLKLGWSQEQINKLDRFASLDSFTPAEKAALHLAEKMTLDSNNFSDAEFAELRSFYSEGEIVELMTAIGLFNYFNRFNNVLRMDPTKPGEGGPAVNKEEPAELSAKL